MFFRGLQFPRLGFARISAKLGVRWLVTIAITQRDTQGQIQTVQTLLESSRLVQQEVEKAAVVFKEEVLGQCLARLILLSSAFCTLQSGTG